MDGEDSFDVLDIVGFLAAEDHEFGFGCRQLNLVFLTIDQGKANHKLRNFHFTAQFPHYCAISTLIIIRDVEQKIEEGDDILNNQDIFPSQTVKAAIGKHVI